jgi:signal transduction histidine kinase
VARSQPGSAGAPTDADHAGDTASEPGALERSLERRLPRAWVGWRLRLLVLAALFGCLSLLGLARSLAQMPFLDAQWQATPQGALLLRSSADPALAALAGRTLATVGSARGAEGDAGTPVDALLLQRSARWLVRDEMRLRWVLEQRQLAALLAEGRVRLSFSDGVQVDVATQLRGWAGLGFGFWPLATLALVLCLVAVAVLLVQPQWRNGLFMLMALSQAGNLLFIALETLRGIGQPAAVAGLNMPLRAAFDIITAAAAVHAFALHPRRLPNARSMAAAAWGSAALWWGLAQTGVLPGLWAWTQATALGLGVAALAVLARSYRIERNPLAALMRRFAAVVLATLLLVTLTVALNASQGGEAQGVAVVGSVVWHLFMALILLMAPFLSRSRQPLREFVMLAGISTVVTSLDLLFVALFPLGPLASLTLAVFLALGVYAGARQWILNHLFGTSALTTERTFEQLYRAARELQAAPARYPLLLSQLLRDMFDPLEVLRVQRSGARTRVVGSGSALVVPVSPVRGGMRASDAVASPGPALVLQFARRGQRLFTQEDARLADRVVDQLRRALAYDEAVERGRSEERQRIAQDLHDDIGARLLTLMYQAQTPEMEEYIRHTLLDLKTLTRGLAASEHRLSHAAAEWKADLTQRLTAAQVQLGWAFTYDNDMLLSVVQWSALTRVLRELVSNALHHAQASRMSVNFQLEDRRLLLQVADDGCGRDPKSWAHGLGLGGVRKRVKLLGGDVVWRENQPRGIVCEVCVPEFVGRD